MLQRIKSIETKYIGATLIRKYKHFEPKKSMKQPIAQIARISDDLPKMTKGLSSLFESKSLSAGSRLQGSNQKKRKNAFNQSPTKEGENSVRFAEDLIKIYDFSRNYKAEITRILGKTVIEPKQE